MVPLAPAPRLVTLDSTGTLMRVPRPVGELYREALLAVLPVPRALPSSAELSRSFLEAYREQAAEVPCFGAGLEGGCRRWWWRLVHNTLAGAGVEARALEGPMFETAFANLYDDVFSGDKAWELLPNTVPALAELRSWCDRRGCRLGVLSNMDDRLPRVLGTLGVLDSFDFVLTSYECGSEKPSPQIFAEARRYAGIDAAAPALHCGDSWKRDVLGARGSGFTGVLVDANAPNLEPLDLNGATVPEANGAALAQHFRVPHIGYLPRLLAESSGL